MKSQTIRLIDVFVLGPGMIYLGAKKSSLHPWEKLFLVGTGVATVVYNYRNYHRMKGND